MPKAKTGLNPIPEQIPIVIPQQEPKPDPMPINVPPPNPVIEPPIEPELPESEAELARTPFSGKGQQNCNICLLDYDATDTLIYLPCFHDFHENCILDWLNRNSTCPICLKPVYRNAPQGTV